MVAAFAVAAYVRAIWIDKLFSWRVAAAHAVISLAVSFGVFWLFGYFVGQNHGKQDSGASAPMCSRFSTRRAPRRLRPPDPRMSDTYDLLAHTSPTTTWDSA